MITWSTFNTANGRVEEIERHHSLEDRIREVSLWAWEDPNPRAIDFAVGDRTGEVPAVSFIGPESELFIICFDGRNLRFEMPESYRE